MARRQKYLLLILTMCTYNNNKKGEEEKHYTVYIYNLFKYVTLSIDKERKE